MLKFIIILLIIIVFSNTFIDGYLVQLTPTIAKICMDQMTYSASLWNTTMCGFPLVGETQSIGFVTLAGSFPFNAPSSIQSRAGPEFRNSVGLHGGIGIIISSTSLSVLYGSSSNNFKFTKLSVEFLAENYISGLFPNVSANKVIWNNNGAIYVRNPIDTSMWLNSKIITETTGLIYLKYIRQVYQTIAAGGYDVFQPISVLTPNISAISSVTPTNQLEIGSLLVNPISSFTFVENTITFLLSEHFRIGTFLQLATTSAFYFHCCVGTGCPPSCSPLSLVNLNITANEIIVSSWYQKLKKCYGSSSNADIQSCYQSYAYVYMNSSMVYNVTLLNMTQYQNESLNNPMIFRYLLEETSVADIEIPQLQPIDIVIVAFFSAMIAAIILFVGIKYYQKKGIRTEKQTSYLDRFNSKMQDDFFYRESGAVVEILPITNKRASTRIE